MIEPQNSSGVITPGGAQMSITERHIELQ